MRRDSGSGGGIPAGSIMRMGLSTEYRSVYSQVFFMFMLFLFGILGWRKQWTFIVEPKFQEEKAKRKSREESYTKRINNNRTTHEESLAWNQWMYNGMNDCWKCVQCKECRIYVQCKECRIYGQRNDCRLYGQWMLKPGTGPLSFFPAGEEVIMGSRAKEESAEAIKIGAAWDPSAIFKHF